MKKIKIEETRHITGADWERLKKAYCHEDWETIHTFTAGHEIDTPTVMRELKKDTRVMRLKRALKPKTGLIGTVADTGQKRYWVPDNNWGAGHYQDEDGNTIWPPS